MGSENYLKQLEEKIHLLTRATYKITKEFPKEELYTASSQLRRAILSVPLNFIEGYARRRPAVKLNFWETSYGSLREARYLIFFAYSEGWITEDMFNSVTKQCDEVGAMLWRAIEPLDKH